MEKKYTLNIAALLLVILIRTLLVPLVMPEEYGSYPRIMSYQIRRDYPMYDLVNLRNLESASLRSGYSMETLIAIDLLMKNHLDPTEAQNGIEAEFKEIVMPDAFKLELMPAKIMEIHTVYSRPARLISILFEITMVIIVSTLFYYILFYLDYRRWTRKEKRVGERVL